MTGQAGRLDTRVSFEMIAEVDTPGGGVSSSWSEQFKRWCGVSYPKLTARLEREDEGALTSVTRASLLIRSDVSTRTINATGWRCVFDGQTWNIRGITPVGRRDRLSLIIESGVAA